MRDFAGHTSSDQHSLYTLPYSIATMVSLTEVKLLTLLNVTAIKKPFEMDVPGGHRGSPALGGRSASASTSSPAPTAVSPATSTKAKTSKGLSSPAMKKGEAGANGEKAKRRKSVVFGGEVGPSGSTFAGKRKRAGGDMAVEVEDGPSKKSTAQANGNGHAEVKAKAAGLEVEEEMSEDEGKGRAGKCLPSLYGLTGLTVQSSPTLSAPTLPKFHPSLQMRPSHKRMRATGASTGSCCQALGELPSCNLVARLKDRRRLLLHHPVRL